MLIKLIKFYNTRRKKEEGRRKKEEGISNKINNLRNLKSANHQGGCYAKQSGDLRF
jgi:hypothetical protein